jgi:hypothetical protein
MPYHTKIFVTNNHLSFLHTWYSMVPFCSWPPHWRILKKCPVPTVITETLLVLIRHLHPLADLAGFLNPVAAPGPPEMEMYCPGLCNPICSPACTRSCCYNSPRSEPHWENMPQPNQNYAMQMNARRSGIPDPTKEEIVSIPRLYMYTSCNKLCSRLVAMLFQQLVNRICSICSHCLFPACWQLCWDLLQVVETCYKLLRLVTSCWDLLQVVETCYKLLRLVTSCWDLLQVVETCYKLLRLVTSCSNNLLSSCNSTICQQVVSDNLVATW